MSSNFATGGPHPLAWPKNSQAMPAKHIVDTLIEERAPKLSKSAAWPVLRPLLYTLLNYSKARRMADDIAPMSGHDALEHISHLLSVKTNVEGLDRIPRDGSFLMIANHPTGITDGIALYDAIKQKRPDAIFYANSDAHRVCPRFEETLIPVEWAVHKRTRERTRLTLKMTDAALSEGRCLVVFPAGRLARMWQGALTDREWMPTAISIARKYKTPIQPVHIAGPYAFWYHLFNTFSPELRDITLFHELLNKQGKTYRLRFGEVIATDQIDGDASAITRKVKYFVERVLAHDINARFDPNGPECRAYDQSPEMQQRPS